MADFTHMRARDRMIASPIITPRTTVSTALRLLRENCLPALPVVDGGRFVGLVDEKALLRLTPSEATTLNAYELHYVLDRVNVAEVTMPSRTVPADAPLSEAAAMMVREAAGVLAIAENSRLVGLLTWNALLAAITGEDSSTDEQHKDLQPQVKARSTPRGRARRARVISLPAQIASLTT